MAAKGKNSKGLETPADFITGSGAGEEPSLDIGRLRDEIEKRIESADDMFGKFRGLVESLQEDIPEEEKRFHAAIKALSRSSGLGPDEVLAAADRQLAELKDLERVLLSALPNAQDEIKAMEAESREIQGELTRLRERVRQLEGKEREMLEDLAVRRKEVKLAEEGVRDVLSDMKEEITGIKRKLDAYASKETPSPAPAPPDPVRTHEREEEGGGGGQESGIREASAPGDAEGQKCPMCGGRMFLNSKDEMWQCLICAHEEPEKGSTGDGGQGAAKAPEPAPAKTEQTAPEPPAPAAAPPAPSSAQKPPRKPKSCPICRDKMGWIESEKSWRCPSCEYQRMEF